MKGSLVIDQVDDWLSFFAMVVTIANSLWIWRMRPMRDTAKKIDDTNGRVDELIAEQNARADRHREDLKAHDRRIQRVEDDLRHLPTKDDLSKVVNELTAVQTELEIVARVVTRIDEFLRAK
jgi:hypothetical protein